MKTTCINRQPANARTKSMTAVIAATVLIPLVGAVHADDHRAVPDSVVEKQRSALATNTFGKGFGPQSPRDIDKFSGANGRVFGQAPHYSQMNLCNI